LGRVADERRFKTEYEKCFKLLDIQPKSNDPSLPVMKKKESELDPILGS